jgi:hypothetical protein
MPTPPGHPDSGSCDDVLARLAEVRRRIAAAAEAAGRRPEDVTLVTITKTFSADVIAPVIEAGLRVFGENRVQEAASQMAAAQGTLARHRTPSGGPSADQQGRRCGGAVRLHRDA